MRLAIVHYHLRPGGVTRVIESTAAALRECGIQVAVVADVHAPAIGYRESPGPATLEAELRAAAAHQLGGPPDAWIIHNPTLGKKRDLPAAIERMTRAGDAVLLHIHDLAEDGRAANFTNIDDPQHLHLTAPRVHHAFINQRDVDHFIAAGLPPHRAHLLPNPVWLGHAAPVRRGAILSSYSPQHPLIFYPVRGIRRKNLGELCLLASFAPPGTTFATSRAPENPEEIPTHDFWRAFAFARDLPVRFDVTDRLAPAPGLDADFNSWCAASTHWITTSVAEGFGQTTAEAAAHGKPVIARRLDVGFPPANAETIYSAIEMPPRGIDFADLEEAAQANWIDRILHDPATADAIRIQHTPARAWLKTRLKIHHPPHNPQLARHAPETVAQQLLDILTTLTATPPGQPIFLSQQKIAAAYPPPRGLLNCPPPRPRTDFPKAVIFDVYGTLLDAPPGGVRPDPTADPAIKYFLENQSIPTPPNPTQALAALVRREHAASPEAFPEIDLVALWAELLGLPADHHTARLVADIEDIWHPATPMPGAHAMLRRLAEMHVPCGLLSNAQANIWRQLGPLAPCFASDLCVFSHQHLRAKPSPELFEAIATRLARRGIAPRDAWFVGNDPAHDIAPAAAAGFRTALIGPAQPPHHNHPDLHLKSWTAFPQI